MSSLLFLAAAAFLLSLGLTRILRDVALRWGIVDRPDGRRKIHACVVPRAGGIAILSAYVGAYVFLLLVPLHAGSVVHAQFSVIRKCLPPIALVFLTGLLDDWRDLRPWQKLLGEAVSAVWAWQAGVRIVSLAGSPLELWWSLPLTAGWLILCSNAFNLIDGVDGGAAGVGLTITLATFIAGVLHGDQTLALATAPLAGALAGFLRYNFNPASVFLGDSGSLLLGFLLGSYAVIWSQKSTTLLGMAAPVLALGLPLLEVGLSIARRFVRNEPIFAPDRDHIHHRLLDRGFPPRRVAFLLYAVCGVTAALSLLPSALHGGLASLAIVFFAAAVWTGVQYLGYAEFHTARRFFLQAFRPMLRAHLQLELLSRSLASSATPEECWAAIEQAGRSLGYQHLAAQLGSLRFATSPQGEPNGAFWQIQIKLAPGCWMRITQGEGERAPGILLIPFAQTIRRALWQKFKAWSAAKHQSDSTISQDLVNLAGALASPVVSVPQNSTTTTVMSSDCNAPPVKAATAS